MITSKTKISPMGKRILIKLLNPADKTKGGLWLPGTTIPRGTEGEVVEVGDGEEDTGYTGKWPPFPVGTRVLVGKWSGEEIELHDLRGESYYMVTIGEIIARLDG